ncbi:MAG: hypothetical protein IKE69_02690 [Thermoguttaceae bacterium]|nr:hypothetical protein [Thermoguttaceae bacterium]
MGAVAKYYRAEPPRADLPGGGRADAPGAVMKKNNKTRLQNQLNRLYDLREAAVKLRTEKRGIPGGLLLELVIILPDIIEDLIQLSQ